MARPNHRRQANRERALKPESIGPVTYAATHSVKKRRDAKMARCARGRRNSGAKWCVTHSRRDGRVGVGIGRATRAVCAYTLTLPTIGIHGAP
jgi:hypothetical protein